MLFVLGLPKIAQFFKLGNAATVVKPSQPNPNPTPMLICKANLGPFDHPNAIRYVYAIEQIDLPPNGRFQCRDLLTGQFYTVMERQLTPVWLPPQQISAAILSQPK